MKLKCNCCDGIYNSLDIHFTSRCDNNCAHCVDKKYNGINQSKPDVDAIVNKVLDYQDKIDDVLFLGGEPCIYLEELLDCVQKIKEKTSLKIYVTTSIPKICFNKKELFYKLISLLDGINLSVQHYDENIADLIRRTKSKYDRQQFYRSLPNKEKIRINLNIVKPFLYTKKSLIDCLSYYNSMGFNSIKLSEIQHGKNHFISFESIFNVKMKSPYSNGCQTYIDMNEFIDGFKTPLLLKRSCCFCENSLKASFSDGIKVISKFFNKSKNTYGVIYENGSFEGGWI